MQPIETLTISNMLKYIIRQNKTKYFQIPLQMTRIWYALTQNLHVTNDNNVILSPGWPGVDYLVGFVFRQLDERCWHICNNVFMAQHDTLGVTCCTRSVAYGTQIIRLWWLKKEKVSTIISEKWYYLKNYKPTL